MELIVFPEKYENKFFRFKGLHKIINNYANKNGVLANTLTNSLLLETAHAYHWTLKWNK